MISFDEFVALVNELSRLFYAELNGRSKSLRSYRSDFTDREFLIIRNTLKYINENFTKDDIEEKFIYMISDKIVLKIFIVNPESFQYKYGKLFVETPLFEDSLTVLTYIHNSKYIRNGTDSYNLFQIYSDIFGEFTRYLLMQNDKKIMTGDDLFEDDGDMLGDILASLMIETGEEDEFLITKVKELMEFTVPDIPYIKLMNSKKLKNYFESLFMN